MAGLVVAVAGSRIGASFATPFILAGIWHLASAAFGLYNTFASSRRRWAWKLFALWVAILPSVLGLVWALAAFIVRPPSSALPPGRAGRSGTAAGF